MAVIYKIYDGSQLGPAAANAADTVAKEALGTDLRGVDQSTAQYGEGEFIYVPFTGTVNAGDFVQVDRFAKTAVQALSSSAVTGHVGIAVASQVAGNYGYVQVRGINDSANILTGTTAGQRLYLTTTPGRVSGTVVAGKGLDGAVAKNTAAANVGVVELIWSSFNGNG